MEHDQTGRAGSGQEAKAKLCVQGGMVRARQVSLEDVMFGGRACRVETHFEGAELEAG